MNHSTYRATVVEIDAAYTEMHARLEQGTLEPTVEIYVNEEFLARARWNGDTAALYKLCEIALRGWRVGVFMAVPPSPQEPARPAAVRRGAPQWLTAIPSARRAGNTSPARRTLVRRNRRSEPGSSSSPRGVRQSLMHLDSRHSVRCKKD
jgi:hypothetical protein